jgi:hypothetical protein
MKRSMKPVLVAVATAAVLVAGTVIQAAEPAPSPDKFEFWVEPDAVEAAQGATAEVTAYLKFTEGEMQGWSWGLCDDEGANPDAVEAIDGTTDGTDTATVNDGSEPDFLATNVVEGGVTHGAVISLLQKVSLAPTDRFSMAKVTYRFDGAPGTTARADFCELGTPVIDPVVVVVGLSIEPATMLGVDFTVKSEGGEPVMKPTFTTEPDLSLIADQSSEAKVRVLMGLSEDSTETMEIQGWSYGLSHDGALLELVAIEPTSQVQTSNGGNAPDFYAVNTSPVGGAGGTVGAVITLLAEPFSVIPVAPGEKVQTETFTYRSAIAIAPGEPSQSTDLAMAHEVLGDPPVAAVVSVASDSLLLTEDGAATITLTGEAPPPLREFVRGDANNDGRVDIADGVWILAWLFRDGLEPPCEDAADANDDGTIDGTDVIRIVFWRLGMQSTPAPAVPFPGCGTDPSDTNSDDPADGLGCAAWGLSCSP